MMQIGIDTSVIVGLLDSRDIWHTPAVNLQEAIEDFFQYQISIRNPF